MFYFPVGALTSKPYAFVSRPWEVVSSEGIDFFDSYLTPIRIDEKGLKIIRILPVVDNFNVGDWISDRVRFSYSSQDNQRIYNNFVFYDENNYIFPAKLLSFLFFISVSKSSSIFYDFGVPSSIEVQSFFYTFSTIYNQRFFNSTNTNVLDFYSGRNFRKEFCSGKKFEDFMASESNLNTAAFFVVNFNTRFASPSFNSFLRNKISRSPYSMFFFGSSFYNNFANFSNFGSNISYFLKFVSSKAKVNKIVYDNFKLFVLSPFSFNLSYYSSYSSNFFLNTFSFNSSSIISSELNFSSFGSSNKNNFFNYDSSIFFNSYSSNFFSSPVKFNFLVESNYDFSCISDKNNTPDFMFSFPYPFSYNSTFFSFSGIHKEFSSYKKLVSVSRIVNDLFFFYFPFYSSSHDFYPYYYSFSSYFYDDYVRDNSRFSGNKMFSTKFNISSDSFFSLESARSHYLRSPVTRYSVPLVLQYSRLRANIYNH